MVNRRYSKVNNYHVLTMGGGLRLLEPSGLHKWGAAHERENERGERDGAP